MVQESLGEYSDENLDLFMENVSKETMTPLHLLLWKIVYSFMVAMWQVVTSV